ncbi:PLP-dependent aminotransferase family protein [Streptomyces avicenniae]|uniref:MocR-like pyridoxine biosynthesis transcription factor PdxR n=1 Tax=Streptomyces avicenniae TaxID=500153 RepID=UPI00069A2908|nr:PLP-dependent aminotransferase family protein [Streptomyces avicenniae]
MGETWADRSLDLHLELSPTRPARALEHALRAAMADGRLAPGMRLPASRTLAADLGIARNTVADVYAQLVAEGWLDSRVGAGTWVGERAGRPRPAARRPAPDAPPLDLRCGIPDVSGFPRRAWAAAARTAVTRAPDADLGYPPVQGAAVLRRVLADYLARTRGVHGDQDHVLVTRGFGDLLAHVCRTLRARGVRRIAVESHGHERHRVIIAAAGLTAVPLPVDEGGADVSALAATDAGAVLLTAAHQFPTGVPLDAARRVEVVRWAERTGGLVVEDDYDGEFRYDRRAIGALQALAPGHVLYAGTASKALAPAVGLAWAMVPDAFLPDLLDRTAAVGGGADALHQLTLAVFMEEHHYDRNVRRLRARYRARREQLDAAVASALPRCRVTGLAAGLHCLVELPEGASERRVEAAARERGLLLEGLTTFAAASSPPGQRRPAMAIGYGAPRPHTYGTALAVAVEAIAAGTGG